MVCGGYEGFGLAHLVLEVGDLGGGGEVPERFLLYPCCIYRFGLVEGTTVKWFLAIGYDNLYLEAITRRDWWLA